MALVHRTESVRIQPERDDAVADLCHNLRTPLTAALGFIQLALREVRSQPDRRGQLPTLEMVDQQLRRISSLIDEAAEELSS